MKTLCLLLIFLGRLLAQTTTIPAGLIYQAAATQAGIDYISPQAGQAIINQKAALNWKSILNSALSEGSIAVLAGGLSGVVSMSKPVELSLALAHAYYDRVGAPILAQALANPNDIPPVLEMNASVTASPGACMENSIYAIWTGGSLKQSRQLLKTGKRATSVTTNVDGLIVTFTPQGLQVLKNISGQAISQFQVVDVLVCAPRQFPAIPAAASGLPATMHPAITHPSLERDGVRWDPAGIEYVPFAR
jgi:hypothetical protein